MMTLVIAANQYWGEKFPPLVELLSTSLTDSGTNRIVRPQRLRLERLGLLP
jgi:hypothetical protein